MLHHSVCRVYCTGNVQYNLGLVVRLSVIFLLSPALYSLVKNFVFLGTMIRMIKKTVDDKAYL